MAQKKRSSDRPRSTASLSVASRSAPPAAAPRSVALEVQRLRTQRGISRAALAEQVGVSAAAIAAVESGASEPSIDLTWSLANALGVSFSALVQAHAPVAGAPVAPVPGVVSRRALLPEAPQRGRSTEVHELKLAAHGSERAAPNPRGTRETLLVTAGRVIVQSDAGEHVLDVGDSLVFRGDAERLYRNPGETDAVIYTMVAPA